MLPFLARKPHRHTRIPKQPLQLARSSIHRRRKTPIAAVSDAPKKKNSEDALRKLTERTFRAIREYFHKCSSTVRNGWHRIRRYLTENVGRHFADNVAWKIIHRLEKNQILRQGETGFAVVGTFPDTFDAIPT